MVYDDHEEIFPNLRILHIKDCENLKQLWEIGNNLEKEDGGGDDQLVGGASILDFPALESLKVFGCENLKRIRLTHRCTEQLKEIKGDNNDWFQRLELEEPSDKPHLQSLFRDSLESIPVMVQGVCSDNFELQLEFTTQFRKLLSVEGNPSIDDVIKAGVVPRFVEFLERQDLPLLQFEAAWALTIIASGTLEHTRVVIDHGVVSKFVQLLSSSNDDVREQAVLALGNVAGDSPSCRDLVLGQGALLPLLSQLNEHSKLSMLRNATRTLSNFCRGEPPPPFEQVKLALPALRHLIHSTDDELVLSNACGALSDLSLGRINDKIQAVIDAGVCPRLVELLHHPSETVVIPALLTVGNIVYFGDDAQKQYVPDNQVLPCLYQLLTQNHHDEIKIIACCIISKITRGNRGQIQAVIKANIFSPLLHILQHAEFKIKLWAAKAISNATSRGSREQIEYLVKQGCIKPLYDNLVCPDPSIVTVCLEGIENILKVGEADKELGKNNGVNIYKQMIDECGGEGKIRNLQIHDNNEINEKAVKILERYWVENEEVEQNTQDCGGSTLEGKTHIISDMKSSSNSQDNLHMKHREELVQSQMPAEPSQDLLETKKRLESISEMVQGVCSDNFELQLEFTAQFRKLLAVEGKPFIDNVIKAGVVPWFVEFLERHDLPQLQYEAAMALTNIAAGTSKHTQVVIDHGAVPKFVQLLSSSDDVIREQAVRALANVAYDYRDLVLRQGALIPLLSQLNEHSKLSMLRIATWTLHFFCRGEPPPPFEQVKLALPALFFLIHSTDDEEVLRDACSALCFLYAGTNQVKIQAVIDAGVCPRLVELLHHTSDSIVLPALLILSSIVAGDDAQTQYVIDNQVLPCLYQLLTQNHQEGIKIKACHTIFCITRGNRGQIQAVIEANIFAPLLHLLQRPEVEIKHLVAFAIYNATREGSREQIEYLVNQGCIKPLCNLLDCPDPLIKKSGLESLKNILMAGEADKELGKNNGVNIYEQMIDEFKGLDKIRNLHSQEVKEMRVTDGSRINKILKL